ncbi:Activator of Hsp90 ATPase homolog 1-like protein [Actinokineospora alba]|uniref:Activator of Hsp90 ATPase homolog 1-like protein n=2 Tax=Actinokineospora alba TaxID=504798 RepID=A0A1H0VR58_9PSEU|nr:Activator of Hsp90 ATPase homolog 1-like protein [Actinokineospora alba]SDP81072.1 Activator of Hsp90 ATPase homolog 1-like protein [Actinokineospora alba]
MSDDGDAFVPHLDGCFLVVDDYERIVFTNAIDSALRPASPTPIAMTAEIVLLDHPDGTDYRITVRHGDPATRALHAELGFAEGWGATTDQLARVVERL